MIAEMNDYLTLTAGRFGYDLGVGFVDIQTGQVISINGDTRYHAMSSFKGPLAAFYLSLLEQGKINSLPTDTKHLIPMLEISANDHTTCVFQRVGGIAPFNDWLAAQGFSREKNFVLKWQDWPCYEGGHTYIPDPDLRYTLGNTALNLPGDGRLLECPIPQLPCDKAFAPTELAVFYAHLYRGEILSASDTATLLGWMEEGKNEAVFLNNLPADAHAIAYVKGGTHQSDAIYRVNFFNEAGIIQTDAGAFALAIFMQRNPAWPGTYPMSEIARIAYKHFTEAHRP
jgi:beta-lactamase class A